MALKGVKGMVSEAKRRGIDKFDDKTYKRMTIKFRKEDDVELLAEMEKAQKSGIPYRVLFTEWMKAYKELNK